MTKSVVMINFDLSSVFIKSPHFKILEQFCSMRLLFYFEFIIFLKTLD